MKLNGEPWIPDFDKSRILPIPDLPPEGYTYAFDGRTGHQVRSVPAGRCGRSCQMCWPEGEE